MAVVVSRVDDRMKVVNPFCAPPRPGMAEVNDEEITMLKSALLAVIALAAGLVAVASPGTAAPCSPGYNP